MSTMVDFGKKLVIGCDHAGVDMKNYLVKKYGADGFNFVDVGTNSAASVDYPDYAFAVCKSVLSGETELGVLICGTGNGMSMTANKMKGIRAALCWNTEIARLARFHNDANVLVLPGRFLSEAEAGEIFKIFMITSFEGGRHIARIEKMDRG
jgi:ribose 5-phosphate isomerase B